MTRDEALDAMIERCRPEAVRDATDVAQILADLCRLLKNDVVPEAAIQTRVFLRG